MASSPAPDPSSELELLLRTFLAETQEGLTEMEQAALHLEEAPQDTEALGTVFRVAHTLKGNAGALGFEAVAELAHVLEDLLSRLRSGELQASPGRVTLLLRAADSVRALMAEGTAARLQARDRALLAELAAEAQRPPEHQSSRVARAERRRGDAGAARTLRVGIDKLDRILDLVGEVAVSRGRLDQMLREGDLAGAREAHHATDALLVDLQNVVRRVRMVPLGPLFQGVARQVRDLARSCGKQARLEIQGEDVEVDTAVIEQLKDPLLHMVRNAVDHGLERPAARERRGKDPCGTITLSAAHEGACVLVEVADDGAGLDRKAILKHAVARGLVTEPERLSDAEVLDLVFEPGFSTASAVSAVSGRGVGLDVVRRNVEALRGRVDIRSSPEAGTTFTIRLPLTLAVIEGFAVRAADETLIVPVGSVVECLDLPPGEREHRRAEGVFELRGEPLPYVRLRSWLGLPDASRAVREQLLVVQHGPGRAGLAVDQLLGEQPAVIKHLDTLFDEVPAVAGSSILPNGRVALILDVAALLRAVVEDAAAASRLTPLPTPPGGTP